MSKRNNKKLLNQIYSRPLPIELSSDKYGVAMPTLFPHNPVSWLFYLTRLIQVNTLYSVPQSLETLIDVSYDSDGIFKVLDEESMAKLWRCGFFGKGTLSRSEPTWKARTIKRLNLDSNTANALSMEEVTNKRRDERKKFKAERSRLQELELKQRKGEISDLESSQLEQLRETLASLRLIDFKLSKDSFDRETDLRFEDLDLIESNQLGRNLEFLQLQAIETFFLKFAVNVIRVNDFSTKQLFLECCRQSGILKPTNKFVLDYVVYHHYRSLGWCVRSGVKFGCDMLLYKRGPPFIHAEYCILVISNDDKARYDWFEMAAKARVIGTVKKTFVLVYVDSPTEERFNSILSSAYSDEGILFQDLFKLYKVTEILYRRWAPSKTRD